jgi:hypothetical protein
MHDCKRIKSRAQIIHHNAGAFGEPLQPPDWKRLQNIEDTEKYKAHEKRFPSQRDSNEGDKLPGDFIDDDELGVFYSSRPDDGGGSRNTDERYDRGCEDCGQGAVCGSDLRAGGGPENYSSDGRPGARTGLEAAYTEESCD